MEWTGEWTPEYEQLVFRVVGSAFKRFISRRGKFVLAVLDLDAIRSAGIVGAVQAFQRYDPRIGASLYSWMFSHARGRMLHEERSQFPGTHNDYDRGTPRCQVLRCSELDRDDNADADHPFDRFVNHVDRDVVERIGAAQIVERAVAVLDDEKDRQVIQCRFFEGMSQQQTAGVVGVTQMQVSRIEKRALSRMRTRLRAQGVTG